MFLRADWQQVSLWLAVGVALLAGRGCDSSPGASDAGTRDGGAPDSGSDARSDAPRDVRAFDAAGDAVRDSGDPDDASGDVARDAGPPGWTPLPGLPEGCTIERAEDPSVLFRPEWVPCGDGFDGCTKLATDEAYDRTVIARDGAHDGEHGYFAVVQAPAGTLRRTLVMARTDGTVLGAWRDPPWAGREGVCLVGSPALGEQSASFMVRYSNPDGPERENRFYRASYEEIGSVTEPVTVLTEEHLFESGIAQEPSVSATTIAIEVQPGGAVYVMQAGGLRALVRLPEELTGIRGSTAVVGSHVLWSEGLPGSIAHGSFTEPTEVYWTVTDVDIMSFDTDGAQVAWVEGHDPSSDWSSYGRVELWVSPYARDPSGLEPRKVRELGKPVTRATVGARHYAFRDFQDWHQLVAVELDTGRLGRWTLPRDYSVGRAPLWITDEEVATASGGDTLFRVSLDAFTYE